METMYMCYNNKNINIKKESQVNKVLQVDTGHSECECEVLQKVDIRHPIAQ